MKIPLGFAIQTSRLSLAIPTADEIEFIWSATRFPGFHDGMLWDKPLSKKELEELHPNSLVMWQNGESYQFTLSNRTNGDRIGRISLSQTPCGWYVGFWTHPDFQGRGYMTEALAGILEFAFQRLKLDRVESCYADWNAASKRVLEKCGFRFIRHVEEGFQKNGRWVAEDVVAITRPEWEAKCETIGQRRDQ